MQLVQLNATYGRRAVALMVIPVTVRSIVPSRGASVALVVEAVIVVLSTPARRGTIALVIIAVTIRGIAPAGVSSKCDRAARQSKGQTACGDEVTYFKPPLCVQRPHRVGGLLNASKRWEPKLAPVTARRPDQRPDNARVGRLVAAPSGPQPARSESKVRT
jgi:hypothetical protein